MLHSIGMISLKQGIASYIAADAFDCEGPCWRKRNEYYFQSRNFITFKRQGEALYKPHDDRFKSAFGEDRFMDSESRKYFQKQIGLWQESAAIYKRFIQPVRKAKHPRSF